MAWSMRHVGDDVLTNMADAPGRPGARDAGENLQVLAG
jgi:hypothetical protein